MRVSRASVEEIGSHPAWEGYPEYEATIMRLGDLSASVQWCEENFGADGAKFFDGNIEWAAPDTALLSDPVVGGAFLLSVVEAFRQGVRGFAQEITVQSQPWPFNLGAINAPVRLLHGEEDSLLRVSHSEHTATLIPGASLEILPGHGHLSIITEIPKLASDLVVELRWPYLPHQSREPRDDHTERGGPGRPRSPGGWAFRIIALIGNTAQAWMPAPV